MREAAWFQFVLLAAAGGACGLAYLITLRRTVFGRSASHMSLLGAIAVFVALTAVALAGVWLVAGGHPESLSTAIAGFVVVRALFGARICGSCEIEAFAPPAEEGPTDPLPPLDSDLHWGAIASDDAGTEAAEQARHTHDRFREYSTV